jgi:hypothetical protein
MKVSAAQSVALAGAAAIGAGLIGFVALPQASHPPTQTRAVALTSGDADIIEATAADVAAAIPADVDGYSFADFVASLQNTMSFGEGYLTQAATAFGEQEYLIGVSDALAGFGNLTAGEQADLLVNGYSFLVDSGGNAGFVLEPIPAPIDLADAFLEAQQFASDAQGSLTAALADFAAGDNYFGLVNIAEIGINSTYASDAIILGLTESLLGAFGTG